MRNKKRSIRMTAVLAVLTVILSVTGTRATAQTETVLHSFNPNTTEGFGPNSGLVFDAAGNLYGTTGLGGNNNDGDVFEIAPKAGGSWAEKSLHTFGDAGSYPDGGVIFDSAGNLYGVSIYGGAHAEGTVFELAPRTGGGWNETILHTFGTGKDGQLPAAGLIFDAAGNLYGTTLDGGAYGGGAVFELTPEAGGTWAEEVLHSFGNGTDGRTPFASLILDAAGNLYSTTQGGGVYSAGTIFELTPQSHGGWTEAVLHSFGNGADGRNPQASLIVDTAGNLYGTTEYGGAYNLGTAFELSPETGGGWSEGILHSFSFTGADGVEPFGSLIFDTAGNLYGTTFDGGAYTGGDSPEGTVFKLTPGAGGVWTETVLHSFGSGTDGGGPSTGLISDASGNLYGTTLDGGAYGGGTVFEITP